MFFARMISLLDILAAALVLVVPGELGDPAVPARYVESEQELLARIEREGNPVRKAKYEIQLGRLMLQQAIGACKKDDHVRCPQLLRAYVERMASSWETLRRSGREAARKPAGFKELDIALRQELRSLEDLQHRVAYEDRAPIEKAAADVEKIRSEVLLALFPGGRSGREENPKPHPLRFRAGSVEP